MKRCSNANTISSHLNSISRMKMTNDSKFIDPSHHGPFRNPPNNIGKNKNTHSTSKELGD